MVRKLLEKLFHRNNKKYISKALLKEFLFAADDD